MLQSNDPQNSIVGTAVTAIAKARRSDLPKLFTLTYDHTKIPTKNSWSRAEFAKKTECEGTLYTNGRLTLDTGVMFKNLDEMKRHFDEMGLYHLVWSNGDEETNAPQGSEKRMYAKGKRP